VPLESPNSKQRPGLRFEAKDPPPRRNGRNSSAKLSSHHGAREPPFGKKFGRQGRPTIFSVLPQKSATNFFPSEIFGSGMGLRCGPWAPEVWQHECRSRLNRTTSRLASGGPYRKRKTHAPPAPKLQTTEGRLFFFLPPQRRSWSWRQSDALAYDFFIHLQEQKPFFSPSQTQIPDRTSDDAEPPFRRCAPL